MREKAFQYEVEFQDLDRNSSVSENTELRYSITGFKMELRRSLKPFVINIYMPTALLVMVSFIGFLIPAEMIPGRMALIVTTFLMLINIENTHRDEGPKVRAQDTFMNNWKKLPIQAKAVTALGIWLLICISFVTMTLFEYAVLLKIRFNRARNVKTVKPATRKTSEMIQKMLMTADENGSASENNYLCATIDKLALALFVIAFFVASLSYWIWYRTKYQ